MEGEGPPKTLVVGLPNYLAMQLMVVGVTVDHKRGDSQATLPQLPGLWGRCAAQEKGDGL